MGLHTCTYRGKRVRIVLKDDEEIIGWFINRTDGGKIILKINRDSGEQRTIRKRDVKSFQVWSAACNKIHKRGLASQ